MYSQTYYLLRAKQDGRHLSARPEDDKTFLLLFGTDHEALTYLSTHAPEMRDRFAVTSVTAYQLNGLLERWGFTGVGLVSDPMPPVIDFMTRDRLT